MTARRLQTVWTPGNTAPEFVITRDADHLVDYGDGKPDAVLVAFAQRFGLYEDMVRALLVHPDRVGWVAYEEVLGSLRVAGVVKKDEGGWGITLPLEQAQAAARLALMGDGHDKGWFGP